jgi:hypothetical protein
MMPVEGRYLRIPDLGRRISVDMRVEGLPPNHIEGGPMRLV